MMNPKTVMAISLLLFMLLLCVPVFAANDDFDAVTGHVSIEPPSRLAILYPTKDVQTTASGFQITGTSDPAKGLTLNGDPVEDRGTGGTFAVYVPLESGKNTFVFRQGGESASLAITRGKTNSASTAATNVEELPKPLPQFDLAVKSGESFSLKCYAPLHRPSPPQSTATTTP